MVTTIARCNRRAALPLVGYALLFLGGCASVPEGSTPAPHDPWEGFNRSVYNFNDAVDGATLEPLARGYRKITPQFARTGVSNFMANLGYPAVFVNDFLQGKAVQGSRDVLRFVVNSTLGLGGFFDVATNLGLPENDEDFGQTLAVWGVPDGPYLMLPLLGPSTLRDAPARVVDVALDLRRYIGSTGTQDKLLAVDIIDQRTRLLAAEGLLDDSYDPYLTLRNAWRQRRQYVIHDGDPPLDDDFFEDDEFFDDPE